LEDLSLYGKIIRMNCEGTGRDAVDWINLGLDRGKRAGSCEHCKLKFISLKYGESLD
jgi:hypothetical protein